MKNVLLILIGSLFAITVAAQTVHNLNSQSTQAIGLRSSSSSVPQEFQKEAKAARAFTINPALQSDGSVKVGDIINLQLFEGQTYTAKVYKIDTNGTNNYSLTLKLPEYPMGSSIITTDANHKSLVTISIPELGKSFISRYDNNGAFYLTEIDHSKIMIPHFENDMIFYDEEIFETEKAKTSIIQLRDAISCGPGYNTNVNEPAIISVLYLYTPAAASVATSYGGINNVIDNMVLTANLSFSNSATGITLTEAFRYEVSYVETGTMSTTLSKLQDPWDGVMDEIHGMRKDKNADMVQLISTDGSSGGLGNTLSSISGNYDRAFSVVYINNVINNITSCTSEHEMGHNMGLGHGARMNDAASGIFNYSFGWDWDEGTQKYCSIMSYPGASNYEDKISRTRVPFFSDPTKQYSIGGAYMGSSIDAPPHNLQADAVRSLKEMKHVIASYSDRAANLPSTPINIVVSAPTENGATFSWDICENAVRYTVWSNLTPTSSSGSSTSATSLRVSSPTRFPNSCDPNEIWITATNECGDEVRSEKITFKTSCPTDPEVTTTAATSITYNSAVLNKTVTPKGEPVEEQGYMYKTASGGTWQKIQVDNLTGLAPNTQYKFYAYATTATGTIINGTVQTFTTILAPPLMALTVGLTAGDGKVVLSPQAAESGYAFYYGRGASTIAAPTYGTAISTISGVAVYTAATDITGTNGTPLFVQVYKVETTGNTIVGYGEASATPTGGGGTTLAFTHSTAFDIPESTVGTAISPTIDVSGGASGGTPPYKFSATGLPAGLSISEAGVISGTPSTAGGAGTSTITVTDSNTPTPATKDIIINYGVISQAALTGIATISNMSPRIGDVLTGSLVGGNNTGALSYAWFVDGSPAGTGSTYTVVEGDLGKTITLNITSSVQTGTLTSASTAAVLKKTGPAAPAAPALDSKTHTSITLVANALYEFSRDGSTWQPSNVFTGLLPSTWYGFFQRVAATTDTEASTASPVANITTDAPPPGALDGDATISNMNPRIGDVLTGSRINGTAIMGTLSYKWFVGGALLGSASTYTVVIEDLGKTIYLIITSSVETGELTSLATAAVLKKTAPSAPLTPTVASKNANSVTLTSTAGYEYSEDGLVWQTSNVFTGLDPSTQYSFYQRIAETSDTYASSSSPALNVTTDKATLGGTVAIAGTTKYGEVLTADVSSLSSAPAVASLGTLSYQWKRGATDIGTNNDTYLLVAADIGSTITVTVKAANCDGDVTSAATTTITKADGPAAQTVTGGYTGNGTTFAYTIAAPTGTQYEYSKDNWATSQTSNVFTGFTTASPATTFYARVAETATAYAGASGNTGAVTFVRLANTSVPTLDYVVTDASSDKTITITTVAGAEYSFNAGAWSGTNSGTFPISTVNIAIRYQATATHDASPVATAAVDLNNAEQPAPAAFTLAFALNVDGVTFTATIPLVTGGEYSFDGITFGAANTKTDCAANTSYTGYVRLVAISGYNASPVTSDTQTSPMLQVATPVISPASGSFTGSQTVGITCTTATAAIYYTTDGSTPTGLSTPYTVPFNIVATTTVKAIAIAPGMSNSAVATVTYTLTTVQSPVTGTAPRITGPASLTLTTGYAAIDFAYTVSGSSPVTVTKTAGDVRITWNNTTRSLDIAEGLNEGVYTVILRASNSFGNFDLTISLTVTDPVYWLEVPSTFNGGKVAVSPLYVAKAGTTVTLTITPDAGYRLDSLLIFNYYDMEILIPFTGSGNTYTFTMPAHHIRVKAVFAPINVGNENVQSGLKVYVRNGILQVSGLATGQAWYVYNILGTPVYYNIATGDKAEVALPGRGLYIVTDGKERVKIMN